MGGVKKVKSGLKKLKSEGGAGGKRGHSNMDHWAFTDEIKSAAKSRRRIEGKQSAQAGVAEYLVAQPSTSLLNKSAK
ncbi:MAG: hypothetical protein SF172_16415 [Burkholderiales bacterium]|nr:hypothetical protein [Burkholderiales bacterium]